MHVIYFSGKFIYISDDEMARVVAFINDRGRVSVAELAAASNQLITLKPVDNPVEATVAREGPTNSL